VAVTADLQVAGLTRRFKTVTALDNLSFTVPAGQIVGFLGPNGAGKTTTMRAIFGLTDLDAGTVRWHDQPVGAAQRRRFGYMPEERGLYPGMAVAEQVAYFGQLHGMSAAAAATAAANWLQMLGLHARSADHVEALSHGNQQRAQLAVALVHEPELLVLDEPLAGLDPPSIDAIGTVLRERAAAGAAVLLSSHQLDLVEDLCDAVVIIDHGRLVVAGSVDELATGGARRLMVRVEQDPHGTWARDLAGVRIDDSGGIDNTGRDGVRLLLDDHADTQHVLMAAMAAGRVTEFSLVRRRLSEVFREAVGTAALGTAALGTMAAGKPTATTGAAALRPAGGSAPDSLPGEAG
jgi:ABC-2 type transport system ATP-binding protein